jgi:inhibitor of KinA sporulation pathway (predicted exonuclease)
MSTPKKILFVDVEATCEESYPRNSNYLNEIIEIGITVFDLKTKKIEESRSIIVIPPTTQISEFCTQLTTITPEFVEEYGIPFVDAMEIMKTNLIQERIFLHHGDIMTIIHSRKIVNGTM